MTCRTCQYLGVPADKTGRIVPRANKAYGCTAPIPVPVLPQSVTRGYGFVWPPSKSFVGPDDGEGCPTYALRVKGPVTKA